jgi:hypothetical protein
LVQQSEAVRGVRWLDEAEDPVHGVRAESAFLEEDPVRSQLEGHGGSGRETQSLPDLDGHGHLALGRYAALQHELRVKSKAVYVKKTHFCPSRLNSSVSELRPRVAGWQDGPGQRARPPTYFR